MMKMRIHSRKKSLQGKMESFRRYHCLLKATIETNPDMVSVKDCYGRNWFKPDWNRCVPTYSTSTYVRMYTHTYVHTVYTFVHRYVFMYVSALYTYVCTWYSRPYSTYCSGNSLKVFPVGVLCHTVQTDLVYSHVRTCLLYMCTYVHKYVPMCIRRYKYIHTYIHVLYFCICTYICIRILCTYVICSLMFSLLMDVHVCICTCLGILLKRLYQVNLLAVSLSVRVLLKKTAMYCQ